MSNISDFLGYAQKAVPWITAAATSNIPALIGLAADAVSKATGKEVEATQEAVAAAVTQASPEDVLKIKAAEIDFKIKMEEMGFKHTEEMARLNVQETEIYATDTADARLRHASDQRVFWLGVVILVIFAAVVGLSMTGSYLVLKGGITLADVGVVAAVFGFLGSLVGYTAANAQQVVAYFFGSSRGSANKDSTLQDAVTKLGKTVK